MAVSQAVVGQRVWRARFLGGARHLRQNLAATGPPNYCPTILRTFLLRLALV